MGGGSRPRVGGADESSGRLVRAKQRAEQATEHPMIGNGAVSSAWQTIGLPVYSCAMCFCSRVCAQSAGYKHFWEETAFMRPTFFKIC